MRPKSLALLLLALGCGLVASIGITQMMRRNGEPTGPTGQTQSIFVAMTDIGLGDLLNSQVLKLEQWPKDKVPVGAFSRIEDIEGRRARTKLYAGEPILENKLLGKGASEQGATALIPKGYRVVPVKVDLVSGGSSLILPGDRVDVMVHLIKDPGREITETVTRTILQDIKVFAVNDMVNLEKDVEGGKSIVAKTISLLVTPEQAAKLMLASQLGVVNLVMRSSEDDQQTPNAQALPSELLGTAVKSQRDKESLLTATDPSANEKTAGFVDFLNSARDKQAAADKAAAAAADKAQAQPAQTWTMRVLKPGDVQEVQFEAEPTGDLLSPLGGWKKPVASNSGGARAAPDEPNPFEPAAPDQPQPKTTVKKAAKDKQQDGARPPAAGKSVPVTKAAAN
jgi:pilus assembly protein CpaB